MKNLLDDKNITLDNPLILALQKGLTKKRDRIDGVLESVIVVCLPIKVQTAEGSWTENGVALSDGTQIVVAEFKGYQKDYKIIKDSVVTFDM